MDMCRTHRLFHTLLLLLTGSGAFAYCLSGPVAPSATPVPGHPLRIVALGDSTTAGALDWAPEIKEVYADCLPGALAPSRIEATVVNAGIGDTTTQQAVARLDRDVRRYHPDLVVVQFGINDSWIESDALARSSIDDILLAGDGIHPNQKGQQLVCRLLADRIASIYAAAVR